MTPERDQASSRITAVMFRDFTPWTQTFKAFSSVRMRRDTAMNMATRPAISAAWKSTTEASEAPKASRMAVKLRGESFRSATVPASPPAMSAL